MISRCAWDKPGTKRAFFGVLFLILAGMAAAGGAPSAPPPPIEYPSEGKVRKLTSSEVLERLEQLEKRFADLASLDAEFEQVRIAEDFDLEKRSNGKLLLKMPDRLRCEYDDKPHPSLTLFVKDTFYLYTPSLNQVDKYQYETPEAARDFFKTLLLGFGVSGKEILESHEVELTAPEAGMDAETVFGLSFKPLREDIRSEIQEIRVWFDKKDLLPQQVRVSKAGDETISLHIRKLALNPPNIPEHLFEPVFPRGTDIIER